MCKSRGISVSRLSCSPQRVFDGLFILVRDEIAAKQNRKNTFYGYASIDAESVRAIVLSNNEKLIPKSSLTVCNPLHADIDRPVEEDKSLDLEIASALVDAAKHQPPLTS